MNARAKPADAPKAESAQAAAMKIVLLESGRGNQPEVIASWREKLDAIPQDSITLLSWYPPRAPLPVDRHVVFGPRLRLRTRARSGAVLLDEIERIARVEEQRRRQQALDRQAGVEPADALEAAEQAADEAEQRRQDEQDLAEQLPESMAGVSGQVPEVPIPDAAPADGGAAEVVLTDDQIAEAQASATEGGPDVGTGTPPAPPDSILALPKHHPDRIKVALRWRARKAVHTVKRSYPVRKGRVAAIRAVGGIPSAFALAIAGWREAGVAVGNADVVLSLDSRSQKAAWVLAQRVHGPAVVVSYPAAKRVLQRRRAELARRTGTM